MTQLVARANKAIASWRYLAYNGRPTNCDSTNTYFASSFAGRTNVVNLRTSDQGDYYCFRAKTADGRAGFFIHQVVLPVPLPPVEPEPDPPVVIADPRPIKISFSQTEQRVVARANQTIAEWRYLIYSQPPNCNQTNSYLDRNDSRVGRSNQAVWVASLNDRYYCFRAKTADGRVGFAIYHIPAVSVSEPDTEAEEVAPVEPPTVTTTAPEPEQPEEPEKPVAEPTKPTVTAQPTEPTAEPEPTTTDADGDDQTMTDSQSPPVPVETDDPLPVDADPEDGGIPSYVWAIAGVILATLIIAVIFRPRYREPIVDTDSEDEL